MMFVCRSSLVSIILYENSRFILCPPNFTGIRNFLSHHRSWASVRICSSNQQADTFLCTSVRIFYQKFGGLVGPERAKMQLTTATTFGWQSNITKTSETNGEVTRSDEVQVFGWVDKNRVDKNWVRRIENAAATFLDYEQIALLKLLWIFKIGT